MRFHSNPLLGNGAETRRDARVSPPAGPARAGAGRGPAIVTMTLARDTSERRRLLGGLRALTRLGLPVYVGDGGSDAAFVRQISRLPGVRVCLIPAGRKPTLVNQLRTAFLEAQESGPEYLLYTEPDKRRFFQDRLRLLLAATDSPQGRRPSLIIAARSARAFATFPEGQRVAESFMNRLSSEALGAEGDYTYGPMLIHQRLFGYLELLPENLGWGWRFFLMAVAHQLRLPLELCAVGSPCPRSQRHEDDGPARDYRLRQLVQNVTGLANGWTCLLDQPAVGPTAWIEAA